MARLMADDGAGARSKRAAKDRSPLRIRTLIGTGGKGDAASKGNERYIFFEANKILKPQFTNVNENLAKRYHEHILKINKLVNKFKN